MENFPQLPGFNFFMPRPAELTEAFTTMINGPKPKLVMRDCFPESSLPFLCDYKLTMAQNPIRGEALNYTKKERVSPKGKRTRAKAQPIIDPIKLNRTQKCLEPMPIVEVLSKNGSHPLLNISSSSFLFARLHRINPDGSSTPTEPDELSGNRAASVFRLKPSKMTEEHGYFIFRDLRVRNPGLYKLTFELNEMVKTSVGDQHVVNNIVMVASTTFEVYERGKLPPAEPLTHIMVALESAGAKLKCRKGTSPEKKKGKKEPQWEAQTVQAAVGDNSHIKERQYKRSKQDAGPTVGQIEARNNQNPLVHRFAPIETVQPFEEYEAPLNNAGYFPAQGHQMPMHPFAAPNGGSGSLVWPLQNTPATMQPPVTHPQQMGEYSQQGQLGMDGGYPPQPQFPVGSSLNGVHFAIGPPPHEVQFHGVPLPNGVQYPVGPQSNEVQYPVGPPSNEVQYMQEYPNFGNDPTLDELDDEGFPPR